jgi:hypothetical protein
MTSSNTICRIPQVARRSTQTSQPLCGRLCTRRRVTSDSLISFSAALEVVPVELALQVDLEVCLEELAVLRVVLAVRPVELAVLEPS